VKSRLYSRIQAQVSPLVRIRSTTLGVYGRQLTGDDCGDYNDATMTLPAAQIALLTIHTLSQKHRRYYSFITAKFWLTLNIFRLWIQKEIYNKTVLIFLATHVCVSTLPRRM